MVMMKASLTKLDYLMEIARKDPEFLEELRQDVFKTLDQSGIDLSRTEFMAMIDIVNGTSVSSLAPKLGKLRTRWGTISEEVSKQYRKGQSKERGPKS